MKWYSCEHASKTDTEEKKLLNKVIIVVFFVHKMYSQFHKMKVQLMSQKPLSHRFSTVLLVLELKNWDDFARTISQYYLKGCIRTDSGY